MSDKVFTLQIDNKKQLLSEADHIRKSVEFFNVQSPLYKIQKLVLGSNKLNSLFTREDTLYVSFKKINDLSYKDHGFIMFGVDSLNIEIHRAQSVKAMEDVKHLLGNMQNSKILNFASIVDLEIDSKNFKKGLCKEIYNDGKYLNMTDLNNSINVQKDFFNEQLIDYRIQIMKDKNKDLISKKSPFVKIK